MKKLPTDFSNDDPSGNPLSAEYFNNIGNVVNDHTEKIKEIFELLEKQKQEINELKEKKGI